MNGPGHIADVLGNSPGANSKFRLITGMKKAQIKTITLRNVDPNLISPNSDVFAVTLELPNTTVEEVVNRTGRLGHLIKIDLGDYAQADDFNKVDPAKVALEYEVDYFSNLGVPIASQKQAIPCVGGLYGTTDCRETRGHLFVGWNFTSMKKQRVATGAYIVRLQYRVKVGDNIPIFGKSEQIWGVVRER
jgi:hypothetical protein